MPFFLLFIMIPLAEIMVFMKMTGIIGLGTSLLLAFLTAILGGAIVKYQGIQTLSKAQNNLNQGQLPSKELFDGLCIVAAGATLITPGFITDIIGFSLLVPALRERLRIALSSSGKFQAHNFTAGQNGFSEQKPHDPDVIDVEYETIDDTKNS